MKVYLAGPWVDREVCGKIGELLEEHVTITHKWWKLEGGEDIAGITKRQFAEADIAGVKAANVVVVFNSSLSEGKSFEQGVAVTLGIPIILITPKGVNPSNNVFHNLYHYLHVNTIDEAIKALKIINWFTQSDTKAFSS